MVALYSEVFDWRQCRGRSQCCGGHVSPSFRLVGRLSGRILNSHGVSQGVRRSSRGCTLCQGGDARRRGDFIDRSHDSRYPATALAVVLGGDDGFPGI